MIDKQTIFEIHRLHHLGWSVRKIARNLRISRVSVKRHLAGPSAAEKRARRASKLDAYQDLIAQFLDQDPEVKAPVVLQRLQAAGFEGKITIVRDCLQKLRQKQHYHRQAFIRFESLPAEMIQIDWGHFGSITYGTERRKLYAFAACECYSRMLYVEFTHCQKQATLHQCLLNAFGYFGGSSEQIVVDNMLTAVIERHGSVIRFNDSFLDFLKIFPAQPLACNPGAPHEKGKIENSIKYLRTNFWPLRSFTDLADINAQVKHWLDTVANVRLHKTTRERPVDRLKKCRLKALPQVLPDCRQTLPVLVHKDFAVRFDTNCYTTPPWCIGKTLTLKADSSRVWIYHKEKQIAVHNRCWQRFQRIEIPAHVQQVKKLKKRLWHDRDISAFCSLGHEAVEYLNGLIQNNLTVKKNICALLALKDQYGASSIIWALNIALQHKAFGADYIENILYQEMTPTTNHLPVRLKDETLNQIRLTEPCLAEYDSLILKRKKDDDRQNQS